MTITIDQEFPAPDAINISPSVSVTFSVVTDGEPVDLDSLNVWIDGREIIVDGQPGPGSRVEPSGLAGFDVVASPNRLLPDQQRVTVRVVADDTLAASPIDVSWLFRIADSRGPIIDIAEPGPGAIVTASPSDLFIRLADPGANAVPVTVLPDFNVTADLEHIRPGETTAQNQIFILPTSFTGTGSTNLDLFEDSAYTFTNNDIGREISIGSETRRYRITSVVSSSQVKVSDPFPEVETSLDWKLYLVNYKVDPSFVGREGQLIEVNSTSDRREIVSVQGPELATYDGAQINLNSESVTVFDDKGLDIFVGGERIVHCGFTDPAATGWNAEIRVISSKIEARITPPPSAPWSVGDNVPVFIRAPDDDGQFSEISYSFDVGDTQGPRVVNVVPEEGTRNIPVTVTPDSDIQFDIVSALGVDINTLDIEVNGVQAWSPSFGPVGDWGSSTNAVIDNGERIVLKRSTPYTDGEIVFIDIQASDNSGNAGERRILRMHFGASDGTSVVNTTLAATDIVRVISYELNTTSFARPTELNHTGYAWDGYYYQNGNRGTEVASWFTELGEFPLAGNIVVTADSGWAIIRPQDPGPWMTCVPLASPGWSMADNDSLTDADFGPDAVLTLAGSNVLVVDFTQDRVERYNSAGRTYGQGTITQRDSDQSGGFPDVSYALPLGPYPVVSCVKSQRDFLLAVGSSGQLSVVQDISFELESLLKIRDQESSGVATVVTQSVPGTWTRLRLGPLDDAENLTAMAIAYNDAGQGQVEILDWYKFLLLGSYSLAFFDDASSPALTAAEIKDLEISHTPEHLAIAALMTGELNLIDWDIAAESATSSDFDETALGLAGVASAETSAVALEPGFTTVRGHIYAAVSSPTDGRVVQFRVHSDGAPNRALELASGQPFTTIAAIGKRHTATRFVNVSMDVA